MAKRTITSKRSVQARTKTKTGCSTCRIRKVKCDETRPSCLRCSKTGRKCDGYDSQFKAVEQVPTEIAVVDLPTVSHEDIELLNRCFSTKTLFDVRLDLAEEAKQVLVASLEDPYVRSAVASLKTLRKDLEAVGDAPGMATSKDHSYGLEQYSLVLENMANKLAYPDTIDPKSILLCCQLMISIEQVRKNYTALARHVVGGLQIMYEYRARPTVTRGMELIPAYHKRLPLVDVFVIKLFAAPCKFSEPVVAADGVGVLTPVSMDSFDDMPSLISTLPALAPNVRAELVKISKGVYELLAQVALVSCGTEATRLLAQRQKLLESLGLWMANLDASGEQITSSEKISLAFLRLFHGVLKIILLRILHDPYDGQIELRDEEVRLQEIANGITERVRDYTTSWGLNQTPPG